MSEIVMGDSAISVYERERTHQTAIKNPSQKRENEDDFCIVASV